MFSIRVHKAMAFYGHTFLQVLNLPMDLRDFSYMLR